MKKYLKLTCLFITTIFVLNLFGACEFRNLKDTLRMRDENGIWECMYNDETYQTCIITGCFKENETNKPNNNYYFFPSYINGIKVTAVGRISYSMFNHSNYDEYKYRYYIPHTIINSLGNISGAYCIAGKDFKNIKYSATVPSDYYEHYCLTFPTATFRKANLKYCLNYNTQDPFYMVDFVPYSLNSEQAAWVLHNGELVDPVWGDNIYKLYIYQNAEWIVSKDNKYLFETDKNEKYFYKSKVLIIPPNPEREGYTFAGWFKEAECINEWDFEKDTLPEFKLDENDNVIFQETALYAKWVQN